MSIIIDEKLSKDIKSFVNKTWPEKRVRWMCKYKSWQTSRYFQVSTPLKDMDLHYELYCGKVQLHIEGKFMNDEYKPFINYLREQVKSDGYVQWRRWMGMTQGLCEINYDIQELEEVFQYLTKIINLFDPIIKRYMKNHLSELSMNTEKNLVPSLAYKIVEREYHNPQPEVKSIGKIDFDMLSIPPYQRPYKWTSKNVNQLITDIITFRNKKQYRLGTLVLHNGEIVDGQQRIITLTLLIKKMYEQLHDEKKKDYYKGFITKIDSFAESAKFPNRYSLHNIVENIHVIEERETDFDDQLFDFVLDKCEFVVIELSNISEAFQFFDSQNARGKDLEAHDLLKAYHLREMATMSEVDSQNIDKWQRQKTEVLKEIFLTLYRAKRWSKGKSARYFTKNNIDEFKGVSLHDGKCYPFYQMEVIAHIFSELYINDPIRKIDQNRMEYPFNLDDQIVNGSRFFDMVRHYSALYNSIKTSKLFPLGGKASEIISCINNYDGMWRPGDQYIRSMFDTLVLYYIDRFGNEELDKVIPKFFIWAFSLRLSNIAIQRASIDNYAKQEDSMLRYIHDAKTPYDIINLNLESIDENDVKSTKCEKIINMFKQLKKIYNNA